MAHPNRAHRRRSRRAGLFVALALLLGGPSARAGDLSGPDPSLSGAAGATAAAPFAVRGFVLNPALAGFAHLGRRGLRLSGGLTVDTRRASTRRVGDDTADTAESPLSPRTLPHVVTVGRLGLAGLTAGAWYEEKSGATVWFPGRDPADPTRPSAYDRQRYGSLGYDIRHHHFGLALAWRPLHWLGLGASVGARWLSLRHRRVLATGTAGNVERQETDVTATLDLQARFVPLGVFGLLLKPRPWLRLGLAVEVSAVARFEGKATLEPAWFDSWTLVPVGAAPAALRLRMPWTLRAGVGVDVWRLSLDVAGTYTDVGRPRTLSAHAPGLQVQPLSWQPDVVSVDQLPLGIVLRRRLSLSATARLALIRGKLWTSVGYGFTQGALDPAHRSAALVSPDRHLAALHLTLRRGPLRVDLSYVRVVAVARTSTGQARQHHLVDPSLAVSITSGRQSRSGDLVHIGLTVDLDLAP